MPDAKIEKLIEIEKSSAKKAGFRQGLLVGFFIPVLFLSVIVIVLTLSRPYVEKKVGEYVVTKVVGDVFSAFPDAYFTNAASNHKISNAEFNRLGRQFLTSLKDKRLTYKELDSVLQTMTDAAK
ncbi:MAG TPA: hypothetical protein ENH29_00005 [Bacteroidetes bacterium]|nr:hypothetical protein [Bacteroidota bacterium]